MCTAVSSTFGGYAQHQELADLAGKVQGFSLVDLVALVAECIFLVGKLAKMPRRDSTQRHKGAKKVTRMARLAVCANFTGR